MAKNHSSILPRDPQKSPQIRSTINFTDPNSKAPNADVIAASRVISSRPSVVNNQPLLGWHRSVVLAGSVMSPFDSAVLHWPPDERVIPLRSRAEVQNWLVTHGMGVDLIHSFSFTPKECISTFPETDGGPQPLGTLSLVETSEFCCDIKYRTRDFWVSECSSYIINRFFDYESENSFRQKYFSFLGQYRKSVQEEIIKHVGELYKVRLNEETKRNERIKEINNIFQPKDSIIYQLKEEYLSLECLNLLHVSSTSRSKEELCESPHIIEPYQNCYQFRLFTLEFCNRLKNELLHFNKVCHEAGASGHNNSSNENERNAKLQNNIKIGKPQTSDGVIMHRGILLDEMGFSDRFNDILLAQVIRPLSRLLFPHDGGPSLDHHFCYAISQSPNQKGNHHHHSGNSDSNKFQTDGPFELMVDNSEISLQVCIGGGVSKGGHLFLYGPRDEPREGGMVKVPLSPPPSSLEHSNEHELDYNDGLGGSGGGGGLSASSKFNKGLLSSSYGPGNGGIGEAVLYCGNEVHRYEPLKADDDDDRIILVIWARSSSYRKEYRLCEDERPIRDSSYTYC